MFTITQNGTSKQKPRLDLDGFSYVKDRTTDEKIYWRCINYKSDRCRSRLHTCIDSKTILKRLGDHTCKFDAADSQLRVFTQQVVDRALTTQETPDMIITNCYKGMFQLIEMKNIGNYSLDFRAL